MTDMTGAGDIGLRVAAEVEVLSDNGYNLGLIHVLSKRSGTRIAPGIRRSVHAGKASVVDPATRIRSRLLIVHLQSGDLDFSARLGGIEAERTVLVVDRVPNFDLDHLLGVFSRQGQVSWAPTNRWVRGGLEGLRDELALESMNWHAVAILSRNLVRNKPFGAPLAIGHIVGSGTNQWSTRDELEAILPVDGSADVIFLGRPPRSLLADKLPKSWRAFEYGKVAVEWVLREVDVLVYFPNEEASEIPDAAIVAALGAGKLVLLPPRLRSHFGDGAVYCDRREVRDRIARYQVDPSVRAAAPVAVQQRFSSETYLDRIRLLTGKRSARRRKGFAHSPATLENSTAIFLASNGVGLGHVARLLSIARRIDERLRPVFVTMAQAAHIIEDFGYPAEYIPSQMYLGASPLEWDDWLGFELERLIDHYGAKLVIYDGNNLPAGLLRAIMALGDCKLAWVKRSMGERGSLPTVENARFCDLIIEPGEIAAEPGFDETARKRRGIVRVNPIRLLDDEELLTREQAAATLGLDPSRPAVLIHLGAGSNRDVNGIIDAGVRSLSLFPEVQIAIAEWANAPAGLSHWPDALVIRGFPLSQYFNAFDFSVGAAGYNSFHEVISFALPTVFVANMMPGMDDQLGRARFAQNVGAAIELPEDRMFELPEICRLLLNERARDHLRQNCRRLRCENGARDAAELIGKLL